MDAEELPVVMLRGPFTPGEVKGLMEAAGAGVLVVDVAGLGPPKLAHVDAIARLQLAAKRAGGRIRLRSPDPAFTALLRLVGLVLEVEGEAEEGEPAGGVEVEVEAG
ncbi:STAS domain-containing protein [Streptomyces acidiscabies]|uniref:STAS domain-containing protein n=1 Tax=Streptomyces acidiscabies TaxID=42234 RepID=UPI0038F5E0EC